MRTTSQADTHEIARLKSLYYAASNRKFPRPESQDLGADSEDEKRAAKAFKAIEDENKAFVERLRRRMDELGVGKDEINEAA